MEPIANQLKQRLMCIIHWWWYYPSDGKERVQVWGKPIKPRENNQAKRKNNQALRKNDQALRKKQSSLEKTIKL